MHTKRSGFLPLLLFCLFVFDLIPLYGFIDSAVDKGIDTFTLLFRMNLYFRFLAFRHG